MKTMSIITCYHDDVELIKHLSRSDEYVVKSLVFPSDEVLIDKIWGVPIYPLSKVLDCVRECDVLYISSRLDCKLKNELHMVANNYHKTVYMPETAVNSRFDFHKTIIPIIFISSLGKELHQLDFLFGLKKCLDNHVGKTIVLTDDARLTMFTDVYNWSKHQKLQISLSNMTVEINSFINKTIAESLASCCIIHCSSGIYNPFTPDIKENDYFFSHVVDACSIDYSVFILPCNFADDVAKESYQRIINQKTDITVDTILVDSVFWDLSRKKVPIRSIRIQDCYSNAVIGGTIVEDKNTDSLCSLVFDDIVSKLSKPNGYQIY